MNPPEAEDVNDQVQNEQWQAPGPVGVPGTQVNWIHLHNGTISATLRDLLRDAGQGTIALPRPRGYVALGRPLLPVNLQ